MKMISGLHYFVTFLLVMISFTLSNKLRTLKEEFSYMCETQRLMILQTLAEKELRIEEDSNCDRVPRSSGDSFSETPPGLRLQSDWDI